MGKKNLADKKKAKKTKAKQGQKAGKKASKKAAKKAGKQAKLRDPGKWKIKSRCCRKNPRCKSCPVVFRRLEKAGAFDGRDVDFNDELTLARRW